MNRKIVVIGGGASGIMSAVQAARYGASVTVLEHNEKPGKKLLASGNGKCNLTNLNPEIREEYRSSCGREETKQFVADVENVIFSNPDLVWVGKAEEDIKLGELKDQNRLTCIYSLDLSGDDILKVLSVLFGILLMVDGLHSALHAWMYARRAGRKWWGVLMVLSAMLFIAGIIILNNPWWDRAHAFLKVIGGIILFAAATGIVRLILVWPIRKK